MCTEALRARDGTDQGPGRSGGLPRGLPAAPQAPSLTPGRALGQTGCHFPDGGRGPVTQAPCRFPGRASSCPQADSARRASASSPSSAV